MKNRHAFVLFELVIVLLIMGIIYALATAQFQNPLLLKKDDIFNLKERLALFKNKPYDHIRLICFKDKETSCLIEKNGELIIDKYSIPENIQFYRFDQENRQTENLFEKKRIGKIYQKEVKFIFSLFPNGSNTSGIFEVENKYYTYPAFFGEVEVYLTMEEAINQLLYPALKSSFLVQ